MTEDERKQINSLIETLIYGELVIKKEGGKIVVVKRTESIKLSK